MDVDIDYVRCTSRRRNVVARGTRLQVSYVFVRVNGVQHSVYSTVVPPPALQTPLSIKRTLYGSSQMHGILHVSLSNNDYGCTR